MTITINGTDGITTPEVTLDNTSADGGQVVLKSSGYSNWNLDNYSGRIRAYYGSTEYFTINSSGNVGIGTSSPTALLQAGNGGTAASTNTEIKINANNGSGSGGFLRGNRNNSDTWIVGDLNVIAGGSNTGLVNYVYGANPYVIYTNGSERARIDSSGNLLVGTTGASPFDSCKVAIAATAEGIRMRNTGSTGASSATMIRFLSAADSTVGSITSTGSATTYATSSDYRLKENIAPMTGALDKVAALKPVTYSWKLDGSTSQGFIAHELAEVCPDAVIGEKDAVETYVDENGVEQTRPVYQGIDTSFLVATLTAAIQELKAIVDEQAAKITALENK